MTTALLNPAFISWAIVGRHKALPTGRRRRGLIPSYSPALPLRAFDPNFPTTLNLNKGLLILNSLHSQSKVLPGFQIAKSLPPIAVWLGPRATENQTSRGIPSSKIPHHIPFPNFAILPYLGFQTNSTNCLQDRTIPWALPQRRLDRVELRCNGSLVRLPKMHTTESLCTPEHHRIVNHSFQSIQHTTDLTDCMYGLAPPGAYQRVQSSKQIQLSIAKSFHGKLFDRIILDFKFHC
jgi:hypothetical protein